MAGQSQINKMKMKAKADKVQEQIDADADEAQICWRPEPPLSRSAAGISRESHRAEGRHSTIRTANGCFVTLNLQ